MNQESIPSRLVVASRNLALAERILLVAAIGGLLVRLAGFHSIVLTVALAGLALIFFLNAFKPSEIPKGEDDPFGFREMLAYMVLPKVMLIGSAVSLIGVSAVAAGLVNPNKLQMLFVGASTIGTSVFLIGIFYLQGVSHLRALSPVIVRTLPILLLDLFLLFRL